MFLISYCILLLNIGNSLAENFQGCTESFDGSKCVYDFHCVNYIETNNGIHHYRVESADTLRNEMGEAMCDNPTVVRYYVYTFYPTHLVYKDLHTEETVPVLRGDTEFLHLITLLDLSNNNYILVPNVTPLDNLAKLSFSRNQLTSVKFSNANELPSLIEIDLSHNTINNIEIVTDEYQYTGLKKIDLCYNYLVKIPEAIFNSLDNLETLDISHNFIDTLTYMTFEGMKKLLCLYLSHNRISDVNSSLFRFKELKQLDLSHNEINTLKVQDFEKLTKLEKLDLSSNSISAIERNVFQYMEHLNSLDLSNNALEIIDKETFANLSNLQIIDLSNNNFKGLPKGLFKGKSITSFSIKQNRLEGSLERGMFEGLKVKELDLSNQRIVFVEDYAFNGLEKLEVLLLNNNNIQLLSKLCFKTLQNLNRLDLSGNKITNIEFDKDDLVNLNSLSLKNNYLTIVKHEHFHGLNTLQLLDLSNNNISQLESNSFKSLRELTYFEISNNPLMGNLEENTFDGLTSLPNLIISCTLLTTIRNSSFYGMVHLKHLNMSHGRINELEYNSFLHTGAVDTIDLSFNQLTAFSLNTTELISVSILLLNNNLLTSITPDAFRGMPGLLKINLARNNIEKIASIAFEDQKELRDLNLSFNSKYKFNVTLIGNLKKLNALSLSGIKNGVSFTQIRDTLLSELELSFSRITDVKALQLRELTRLDTLVLSNNDVEKLETGALSNIKSLRNLDLSFNKISVIQPGTFKDNTELYSLNISHNSLNVIAYGIFRGLIHLNTLDVSFNNIKDLQIERFHDVQSLNILIADHNKINSINAEGLTRMSLTELSIGANPLPCEFLVNLKNNELPLKVTAISLDENGDENIDGVTCNMNKYHPYVTSGDRENELNEKILINIRDILFNYSRKIVPEDNRITTKDETYLPNITHQIEASAADTGNKVSYLANLTSIVVIESKKTNVLLERILKVFTLNPVTTTPIPITKDNATFENLFIFINQMKQELKAVAEKMDSNRNEIDNEISSLNSRVNLISIDKPKHEKLMSEEPRQDLESESIYTEACVSVILIILVGIVLYKFYKSKIYIRKRLSISTRELPGAMENSAL